MPTLDSPIACRTLWIALLTVLGLAQPSAATAVCYSTPAAAIDAIQSQSRASASLRTSEGGYRIARLQSDPLLGQQWLMIANCDHPDWPLSGFQVDALNAAIPSFGREPARIASARPTPVVHAGDIVRLWKQEPILRLEVAGISEDNGSLGAKIRVRLLHRNTDSSSSPDSFVGIVRGSADVEMQP